MFPECFDPMLYPYHFLQFKNVFKITTYFINNELFISCRLDEERSGGFQLVQLFICLRRFLLLTPVPCLTSSWNAPPSLPQLNCRGLFWSLLLQKPHLIILQSLYYLTSLFSTCHDLTSCVRVHLFIVYLLSLDSKLHISRDLICLVPFNMVKYLLCAQLIMNEWMTWESL